MRTLIAMKSTYRCVAKLASRLCIGRRTTVFVALGCVVLLARLPLFGGLAKRMNIAASSQSLAAAGQLGQDQEVRLDSAKIEVNFGVEPFGENVSGQSKMSLNKEHSEGRTKITNFSLLVGLQGKLWQDVHSSKQQIKAASTSDENNSSILLHFDKLVATEQLVGEPLSMADNGNDVKLNKTLKEAFRPLLPAKKKAQLVKCLRFLADKLLQRKVTYFLYSGSLLGAHRHRGMIPWDDDVDIIANFSQASEVAKALKVNHNCKLLLEKSYRYKLYPVHGDPIPRRQWKWPFIDIFFFNETTTHLYDMTPIPDGVYSFMKSDVFPLAYRPFEGIWMPVPANEERVIALDFHENLCKTGYYSHRYEADVPDEEVFSVPCEKLYKIHPFIFRTQEGNMTKELLRVGDTVLNEYTYPRYSKHTERSAISVYSPPVQRKVNNT